MINLPFLGPTATVTLTLNERAECINGLSAWVFFIENQQTGQTTVFTAPDIALGTGSRFNQFIWQSVGATSADLQNGRFSVPQSGTFDYVAYQFDASTLPSLDLSNAIAEVERGLLRIGQTDTLPAFTSGPATIPTFTA